jgi:hypothetical protein
VATAEVLTIAAVDKHGVDGSWALWIGDQRQADDLCVGV